MKIEFYQIDDGVILNDTNDYYFVMNNEVYSDNNNTYESQCAVVSFEDFIIRRANIGWRIGA